MKIYGFNFDLNERYFGLHENLIVVSILTLILITLKFFKIIDYDALWIFSPLWIMVIGIISVYVITSILRVKPSVDEKGKYFNYCSFGTHPGIMSARKARWCVGRYCNKHSKCKDHRIYREDISNFKN